MEGNEAARQQLDESLRKGLRVPHVRVCARGPHNKLPTQPAITSCPPHPTHTNTQTHTRRQGSGPKGDLGEALRRIDAVLDARGLSLLKARLPRAYAEYCQGERLLLQAARG